MRWSQFVKLIMQPSVSGFITAAELGHQRKRVVRISTGSKQLDAILGGYNVLLRAGEYMLICSKGIPKHEYQRGMSSAPDSSQADHGRQGVWRVPSVLSFPRRIPFVYL